MSSLSPPPTWAPEKSWAELPLDTLMCVFHKLEYPDLMFGGPSVACRTWRRATRQPELWRHIDMRGDSSLNRTARLLANPFSAGQCESFLGDDHVDNDLLLYLAKQAPSLKSLSLVVSRRNREPFAETLKKFSLLEEPALSTYNYTYARRLLEFCPQLKHYKHVKEFYVPGKFTDIGPGQYRNMEAFAIARMPGLISVQLFRNDLDNAGLSAILENCPHLELLDLRNCPNIHMDSSLLVKRALTNMKKLWRYV